MRTVTTTITAAVLLPALLVAASSAEARLKYYRYNANIPMVEMTLNMMVAMGVLEPIPSRLVYDGNPYNRYLRSGYDRSYRSPYGYPLRTAYSGRSRYYDDYWDGPTRPYRGYSRSRYGYGPDGWDRYRGGYLDSPWSDAWSSPWYSTSENPWLGRSYSPWSGGWGNRRFSPWDTYGASPWDIYGASPWDLYGSSPWDMYGSSPGNRYGSYGVWGDPWSDSLYYGRGLSPWSSVWGSQWINPLYSPYSLYPGGLPALQGYSGVPVLPDSLLNNSWSTTPSLPEQPAPSRQDDSSRGFNPEKTSWSARSSRIHAPYRTHPVRSAGYKAGKPVNQKLNGLWIDDNGEMLGIRGDRFLWYSSNRYAKGRLVKSPTTMEARIPETRTVVRFHYRLNGNEMVIMSGDGKTRTFNRMPLIQPQRAAAKPAAASRLYDSGAANLHVRYAGYRAGEETPVIEYPHLRPGSDRTPAARTPGSAGLKALKASYSQRPAVRPSTASYPLDAGASRSMHTRVPDETGDALRAIRRDRVDPEVSTDANGPTEAAGIRRSAAGEAAVQANAGTDMAAQGAVTDPDADASPGPVSNDPYTYLFSYLKDADNPGGADAAGGRRPNIWQPNELFPHRRGDSVTGEGGGSAGGQVAAGNAQKDYVWTQPRPWEW